MKTKTGDVGCPRCGARPGEHCFKQPFYDLKHRKSYHQERTKASKHAPAYSVALKEAMAANDRLIEQIRIATPALHPAERPHRHRETPSERQHALDLSLVTAEAALCLCASLHPQGCPPRLHRSSALIDEAVRLLADARRTIRRR